MQKEGMMNKKNLIIIGIILAVVIIGGGVFYYGYHRGWFGSFASTFSPSPTPQPTGSISGKVVFENSKLVVKAWCDIYLTDGGGGSLILWTQTRSGLFRFDNLYPGSNYIVSASCWVPAPGTIGVIKENYFGTRGPLRVNAGKTTNVIITVRETGIPPIR